MLKITVKNLNSTTVMNIEGEMDLYSSPEVRDELLNLIARKPPLLIVNLKELHYIDSSGLATLIEGLQQAGEYSGKLILTGLREEVKNVFELSRLDQVFEIYNSLDEALKISQ